MSVLPQHPRGLPRVLLAATGAVLLPLALVHAAGAAAPAGGRSAEPSVCPSVDPLDLPPLDCPTAPPSDPDVPDPEPPSGPAPAPEPGPEPAAPAAPAPAPPPAPGPPPPSSVRQLHTTSRLLLQAVVVPDVALPPVDALPPLLSPIQIAPPAPAAAGVDKALARAQPLLKVRSLPAATGRKALWGDPALLLLVAIAAYLLYATRGEAHSARLQPAPVRHGAGAEVVASGRGRAAAVAASLARWVVAPLAAAARVLRTAGAPAARALRRLRRQRPSAG